MNRALSLNQITMATIFEVADRFHKMVEEFKPAVEKSLDEETDLINEIIHEQLLSGIDENEHPLRPTYLGDPYFVETTKTPEGAKRKARWYKNMKEEITPPRPSHLLNYPARDSNTPNLIIKGNFHDSITPRIMGWKIVTTTEGFADGPAIVEKYGESILGISPRGREVLIKKVIKPAIERLFKKYRFK